MLVWAVVVAVATLVYGRLRGYTMSGMLFLTIVALLLIPLLIMIVVIVALGSCNCDPGG